LTDPDILADYTCEFFGPQGPYPVQDQQQAYAEPEYYSPSLERANMPVPPSPQFDMDSQNFWDNFGSVAERDPSNAWRYLSQAQRNPGVFRQKLLVME
jgi:hypothetical protein